MTNIEAHNSKMTETFAHRLLSWYARHARSMPWRVSPAQHAQGVRADPYRVWLSEVMLQQTQVATVKAYFEKFVALWPDVGALARADEEDVLKAWAGLGYYSRARNLKRCAEQVVETFGGTFPRTASELIKLPGIGDYTASAIASIAFDEPVVVIDGNVERVISRHSRIETPLPAAKVPIRAILDEQLPRDKPGEFAQALMDLGATLCSPKNPACGLCPVSEDCSAARNGDPHLFPVKTPKREKPTRKGAAYILLNERGEVFLCKRPDTGLLAGMTQVPTTEWTARQDGETGTDAAPASGEWQLVGEARHTFTHFHLRLEVWIAENCDMPKLNGWWSPPQQLSDEALPTLMRKVCAVAEKAGAL